MHSDDLLILAVLLRMMNS